MLNEENAVGFNANLAKANIANFQRIVDDCIADFWKCFEYLFEELSFAWASDNAVNFYNIYSEKVQNASTELLGIEYTMCGNAAKAYNFMALTNGSETISTEYAIRGFVLVYLPPLTNNRNGIKGMNINYVKDYILPTFLAKISTLYVSVGSIPTSIALYDTEGSQAGAFSTSASNYKTTIENLVSEIVTGIREYIAVETNNLMLAKQQSTEAMNMNMNS